MQEVRKKKEEKQIWEKEIFSHFGRFFLRCKVNPSSVLGIVIMPALHVLQGLLFKCMQGNQLLREQQFV